MHVNGPKMRHGDVHDIGMAEAYQEPSNLAIPIIKTKQKISLKGHGIDMYTHLDIDMYLFTYVKRT